MKLSIILSVGVCASLLAYNAYSLTCGAQPSCASLGYSYTGSTTDCVNTPMKCPFNTSYFNCTKKADVFKNMQLNWNSKVSQSFGVTISASKYGCIFATVMDNGSGGAKYTFNGQSFDISAYQQRANVFFCVGPGDTYKISRATNDANDRFYFIPYKGN